MFGEPRVFARRGVERGSRPTGCQVTWGIDGFACACKRASPIAHRSRDSRSFGGHRCDAIKTQRKGARGSSVFDGARGGGTICRVCLVAPRNAPTGGRANPGLAWRAPSPRPPIDTGRVRACACGLVVDPGRFSSKGVAGEPREVA